MRVISLALAFVWLAASAASAGPRVDLTKIADAMAPGQVFQKYKHCLYQFPVKTPTWTATDSARLRDQSQMLRDAFRAEVAGSGVSTVGRGGDLFSNESEPAQFLVGALVKRVAFDICGMADDSGTFIRGEAVIDVEWQVYSVAEAKVVARITTNGTFKRRGVAEEWRDPAILGAFTNAAHNLATSGQLERAISTPAPAASATAAPATLTISMAAVGSAVLLKQASRSVVSIFAGDGMGSGVLVSPDGYILTNHHVAGDAGRVRVRWADGTETVGEVVRADRRRDVALVKVAATTTPTLAIRHTEVDVGETVFAIGTPLDKELSGTLTRGVVSARRIREGQPFIQSDVAVTHGNSGGPLLDEKGSVVGLTVSGLAPDGSPIGLNFFIPIDDALKALVIVPAG